MGITRAVREKGPSRTLKRIFSFLSGLYRNRPAKTVKSNVTVFTCSASA